jgi:pimeloyl-ACP methyl ester carboxylesterase
VSDSTSIEQIRSADGTAIACWRSGQGSPLVLVHGSIGDHRRFALLAPLLESRVELWTIDRRGFGASGDGPEYAVEREFEDVAAVIDAIGGPVDLFGHSFGATVALGAAPLTPNVRRLVLYEPTAGLPPQPGVADELDRLLARGEREQTLLTFLRAIGATDEDVEEYRASELAEHLPIAHTVAREVRAEEGWPFAPEAYGAPEVPALLLLGGDSPEWGREGTAVAQVALRCSQVAILEGRGHIALWTAPELVRRARQALPRLRRSPASRTPTSSLHQRRSRPGRGEPDRTGRIEPPSDRHDRFDGRRLAIAVTLRF